jgi:hypothetical protein
MASPPPSAAAPGPARARPSSLWPDALGWRFAVTVDTEEEFDWHAPFSRSATATTAIAALPAAHARFAAAGVPLILLVDYPVAADPRAVDTLRGLVTPGGSAIGAQLHPWVNPPFEEAVTARNSFLGNLPVALQRAKLAALTDRITLSFGAPPRMFRAGRYGLGPDTMRLLAEHGYLIDTSERPGFDYRKLGGPDFSDRPTEPRRPLADHPLVELPLSTVYIGRWRRHGAARYRRIVGWPGARSIAARLGLLSRVSLSPEAMPIADAREAVQRAVADAPAGLLNFSFHSPSLVPGHTPYVRDAADLARFDAWWDAMLALLDRLGVRAIGEAELIARLVGNAKDLPGSARLR